MIDDHQHRNQDLIVRPNPMKSLQNLKDSTFWTCRSMLSLALAGLAATWTAAALANGPGLGPGSGSSGGDPTVGTLPITGGEGADFDQTLTLRGPALSVRESIRAASGDGEVEVIDLGGGEAWLRFYGDVTIELDLGRVRDLDLEIFGGFEGGGTLYAIETADGMGAPFGLESGYSLDLEHDRLLIEGLLDESLVIHAAHRSGHRTRTALHVDATSGALVLRQQL